MSSLIYKGSNLMGLLKKAKDILFSNTGTGLTSDNVQDAIVEINNNLSDNAISAYVSYSITARYGTDWYVTPDDGYVRIGAASGSYTCLYMNDVPLFYLFQTKTGSADQASLFVRKGTKLALDPNGGSDGWAAFYPLYTKN